LSAINGVRALKKRTKAEPRTVIVGGVGRSCQDVHQMLHYWPEARFVGVEPLREHIRFLRSRRLFPGDLIQAALWSEAGKSQLHCNYEPDQRASLYGLVSTIPGEIVRKTSLITLEDLHKRTGPWEEPVLLWLDVEGSELEALKGGDLGRFSWINLELWAFPMRKAPLAREVDAYLSEAGWEIFSWHTVGKDGHQIDAIYIPRASWEELRESRCSNAVERKKQRMRQWCEKRQREWREPDAGHDCDPCAPREPEAAR
jgi:FkbM family methyltransferase